MSEKTDPSVVLKGADELHLKDVGVFFIKDKKAYHADGSPVKKGELFVCQHCQHSPPFATPREIDFARHMIEKHPEQATTKVQEAVDEAVVKTDKKTKKKTKKAVKKKKKKSGR